ncbi:hypothetical protein H0486_00700 [Lachnospiraceae bacterium MD1]|jgi:hypothetical protein|uniref:Metallothionein n=1 Tax=Variimorphobacter saccharofermentans TaxID=2755051 RepID=A0A839JVX3_9FIRM|nr:hypothetical protein [Variimorphobacter saccharofermentans]MBB2181414.1 hypothetical protein [Variimorphobacter saccharofermentans]
MFEFKKSVAGVVKEEFECECCGTLDGQAPTGCGCGSMPAINYASSNCCDISTENDKPSANSGCGCSCSCS